MPFAKVPVCMERDLRSGLPLRARGLAALRGVLDSSASRDFLALLELLAAERINAASVAETFGRRDIYT